ncbi:MAG: hypothetical protein AB8B64_24880 [Granulosicoccus sp.]
MDCTFKTYKTKLACAVNTALDSMVRDDSYTHFEREMSSTNPTPVELIGRNL